MVIRAALFIATTVRWQDGVFMEVAPPFSSSGPHVVCGVVCVCVAARWPGPAIVR